MKTKEPSKKMLKKEFSKLSKKKKKELATLDRKGTPGDMRPAVFADRRFEKTRPNIDRMYRSGKLD